MSANGLLDAFIIGRAPSSVAGLASSPSSSPSPPSSYPQPHSLPCEMLERSSSIMGSQLAVWKNNISAIFFLLSIWRIALWPFFIRALWCVTRQMPSSPPLWPPTLWISLRSLFLILVLFFCGFFISFLAKTQTHKTRPLSDLKSSVKSVYAKKRRTTNLGWAQSVLSLIWKIFEFCAFLGSVVSH